MAKANPICSIPECGKTAHNIRGWCSAHYQRWRAHGDPLGGGPSISPKGEPERFFQEVVIPFVGDDCLIWPYGRDSAGYAVLHWDGKTGRGHRRACEERHGPPPSPDHEAAHSCGKGGDGCVNPGHLRWATHAENMADTVEHGTHTRGERCGTSKITEEDVRAIRRLAGSMFQRDIADMFGIGQHAVSRIISRKRWAWLD